MTNFDSVKDSGERREFATGSVRDVRTGKGRYDLISVLAMRRLAKHTENGAVKYGDRNWEKGQPIMTYIDSGKRHIDNHIEGRRDEDHLSAAFWNLMAAIHTEEMIERGLLPKELDDRPNYMPNPQIRSQSENMARQASAPPSAPAGSFDVLKVKYANLPSNT